MERRLAHGNQSILVTSVLYISKQLLEDRLAAVNTATDKRPLYALASYLLPQRRPPERVCWGQRPLCGAWEVPSSLRQGQASGTFLQVHWAHEGPGLWHSPRVDHVLIPSWATFVIFGQMNSQGYERAAGCL